MGKRGRDVVENGPSDSGVDLGPGHGNTLRNSNLGGARPMFDNVLNLADTLLRFEGAEAAAIEPDRTVKNGSGHGANEPAFRNEGWERLSLEVM
jgi:hypothetical protein